MIDRREIIEVAKVLSLRPQVIEKDYVLGWLLAGINRNPILAPSFVFKGGTCLKKCYFETYRFSEDLDFTISDPGLIDEPILMGAFTEVCEWLYQESGIETFADRLRFKIYTNPRDEKSCQGRFYYRGPVSPRGDPPRIKLDLTADEVLVLEPAIREVNHSYSDAPERGIHARSYAFEEVFGEKIRALGERCRPRDLYDVIHLYRREWVPTLAQSVLDVLKKKCRFKGIGLPTLDALLPRRAELDAAWEDMLAHQLQALPPVDQFWSALTEFFRWLYAPTASSMPEGAAVSSSGAPVFRSELGGGTLGYVQGAPAMESIFFAAANRLCIDLGYKNRIRRLEPYSLRRTNDGNLLFFGAKAESGEIRCFRVDRIQSAVVTRQSFAPRYAVELTSSGPLSIPRAQSGRPYGSNLERSQSFSPHSHGIRYVHECVACGRRFAHKTNSTTLKPHKDKGGSPCPGRRGMLVDSRF